MRKDSKNLFVCTPRRETNDVGNFWVDSLRAPLQLVIAQFFKNPDLNFVHNACKWNCGKFFFCLLSPTDFQVVQEPKKLMESANNRSNRVATIALTLLISSHEKRFQESFCVHAPRLVVKPTTLGISG
jgi:hypothetical protein